MRIKPITNGDKLLERIVFKDKRDYEVGLPLDHIELAYLDAYNEYYNAYEYSMAHSEQYSTLQLLRLISLGLRFDMNKILHLQSRLNFFGIKTDIYNL